MLSRRLQNIALTVPRATTLLQGHDISNLPSDAQNYKDEVNDAAICLGDKWED